MDEADFKKIVNKLNIDDQVNPEHRERLRQEMLSAFNSAEKFSYVKTPDEVKQTHFQFTISKSLIAKVAVAAVILIVVLIGIKFIIAPAKEPVREVAKETTVEQQVAAPVEETHEAKLLAELKNMELLYANGDIEGLLQILQQGQIQSKLLAANYLIKLGDVDAIEALENFIGQLDSNQLEELFAAVADELQQRSLEEQKTSPETAETETQKTPVTRQEAARPIIYGRLLNNQNDPVSGYVIFGASDSDRIDADEYGEFELPEPKGQKDDIYICYAADLDKKIGRSFLWQRTTEPNDLEIILEPFISIVGSIVYPGGEPVTDTNPKIKIIVPHSNLNTLHGTVIQEYKTTMNNDGSFRIEDVPVGLGIIVFADGVDESNWVKPAIEHGRVIDVGDIIKQAKDEPQQEQIQFSETLTGRVMDPNGQPIVGFDVLASFDEQSFEDITDLVGRYELMDMPKGKKITLRAVGTIDGEIYTSEPIEIICDANDVDIEVTLSPYE